MRAGHDQLVFVLGNIWRKRRRHVEHVVAAGDRLGPARIVFEIGGDEGQAIARLGASLLQHGAHVTGAIQVPHRGAHLVARLQELQDAVAADEPRAAGNQNGAHRRLILVQCRARVIGFRETPSRSTFVKRIVGVAAGAHGCRKSRGRIG